MIKKKLNSFSVGKIIILATILLGLISLFFNSIAYFFELETTNNNLTFSEGNVMKIFVVGVIIAPIFETFVFQYVLLELIYKLNNEYLRKLNVLKFRYSYAIIVSAVAFSLSHPYNLFYYIFSFFSGLVLAMLYLYIKSRSDSGMAYLVCFLVHLMNNFFAFSLFIFTY